MSARHEDDELLRRAFADVKPLKKRSTRKAPITSAKPVVPMVEKKAKAAVAPAPAFSPPPPAKPLPSLEAGTTVGVDFQTVRKLRRGRFIVDARLDLHGHTQDTAHSALTNFIERAQASGLRCLLVITGKGGVLRVEVPRWLNLAPNRGRILSFVTARPADGGEGALYVLLKRVRAP